MEMLKRKITEALQEWKAAGVRQALYIAGARQIGKSTAVRAFGEAQYGVFIEINFIETPAAGEIFARTHNADQILKDLAAFSGLEIVPHQTLVLLDEIQACPQARNALRFLVEDDRADYVEAGLLPAENLQDETPDPAGYEKIIRMHPMDFEEFVWACGMPQSVLERLREDYRNRRQPSTVVHTKFLQLFYTWMVVGGMPQVVQTYMDSHDMARVDHLQQEILGIYRRDIEENAPSVCRWKIRTILDSIPGQLNRKNRRFRLTEVQKEARMRQLASSFLWLKQRGITLCSREIRKLQTPLRKNAKASCFHLYLCDTGLLCSLSDERVQFPLLKGDVSVCSGSLLENAFAQSLTSKGKELYYCQTKQTGTLDFIVSEEQRCAAIKIRSGKHRSKGRVQDKALLRPDWVSENTVIFSADPLREENGILHLPFYMILFF